MIKWLPVRAHYSRPIYMTFFQRKSFENRNIRTGFCDAFRLPRAFVHVTWTLVKNSVIENNQIKHDNQSNAIITTQRGNTVYFSVKASYVCGLCHFLAGAWAVCKHTAVPVTVK